MKVNRKIVFGSFVLGFILGVSTLYFFEHEKFDKLLDKFLNWPFLGFVLILILALLFYDYIEKLLSRGEIKVKWGDSEIFFNDIPEKVEQEVSNQLEKQNQELDNENKSIISNNIISKIKNEFSIVDDNLASLIFQIGESNLVWRNLFTLAKRTGIEPKDIEKLCRENPEIIKRGIGKSGNIIFKLQDNAKKIFDHKIKSF